MSRLTLLHINIIGAVVAIIVAVALYFTIITGAKEKIETNQKDYEAVKAVADELPKSQQELAAAQKSKEESETAWNKYVKSVVPVLNYGGMNRVTAMMKVWWPSKDKKSSWPERFLIAVNNHMVREKKANGIEWLNPNAVVIPVPGPDPNTVEMGSKKAPLIYGPYQMVVRAKDPNKFFDHIKSWSTVTGMGVPRVELANVSGNTPNMTMTYSLTFTVILNEDAPAPIGRIGGSGGGNNAGGFGGGAPPNFGPPGPGYGSGPGGGAGTRGAGGPPPSFGPPPDTGGKPGAAGRD